MKLHLMMAAPLLLTSLAGCTTTDVDDTDEENVEAISQPLISDCASTGIVALIPVFGTIATPDLSQPGVCAAPTTHALRLAVNDPACTDVVLTAPEYSLETPTSTHLRVQRTVQIWGRGADQTLLRFGVEFRPSVGVAGASNSSLRGVTIDVDSTTAVDVGPNVPTWTRTSAISLWEPADASTGNLEGVTLEDIRIWGSEEVDVGVSATAPRRAFFRRIEVNGVEQFGVSLRNFRAARVLPSEGPRLYDIRVVGVKDPSCLVWQQTSGCPYPGTHQAGIWVGASHTFLRRAHVRDVFAAGIATGRVIQGQIQSPSGAPYGVEGLYLTDLDVDRIGLDEVGGIPGRGPGTGIYIERIMRSSIVRQFCIGPETERGINAEWNHDELGSGQFRVSNGWIASEYFGVGFDAGTYGAYVDNIAVTQPRWSGLVFYQNWEGYTQGAPPQPNTTAWSSIVLGPGTTACTPGAAYPATDPCACVVSFSHYDPSASRFCEAP